MASRSIRCAITQVLLRCKALGKLASDQGTQAKAVRRLPEHLLLAFSMSSVPHRGRNSDVRQARAPDDGLMFLDSGQEEILSEFQVEEKTESKERIWSSQFAWLSNMVEPALSMYKRTPPPGELAEKWDGSTSGRSLVDIVTGLLKSTTGMQEWGLSDITLGLYLLSLRHTAEMAVDTIPGEKVTSDVMVHDWIYFLELAWGAYMKDALVLARVSMLRTENVVKFVGKASVMRPAYYIGFDPRHELVIMSIRGTQTIHDLVTDLSSDSEHAGKFDGEHVHYGSVEAARWFVQNEAVTLRECLSAHKGFGLLLIGHSLGGATAALLGMLLREDSQKLIGLCPDQIRAVGIGTPPCVSKALASRCRDSTATLVLQDDVIPRVSATALIRLRNEILCTDWNDVLKEGVERKGLLDLVASTIQALTSVQDAARKYGALARRTINLHGAAAEVKSSAEKVVSDDDLEKQKQELLRSVKMPKESPELVAPGTVFHICSREIKTPEFIRNPEGTGCTLWKGKAESYLERIVISSSMFSDHRCESYYYSLRDVLKGLPNSREVTQF